MQIVKTVPFVSILVSTSLLFACSDSPPRTTASESAYSRSVELSQKGDDDAALETLHIALQQEPEACQKALLDPAFETLRDEEQFRKAVHEAAVTHKISRLTIAPQDETGEWVEIEGLVVDTNKKPIPGAVVNVFGTAEDGRYHPTIEGERTPRLFGILVTDSEGKFWFRTIRPGPYPGTRNARHFHIWATVEGKRMAAPHYAVLGDDPLLDEPQNAEQRGEAIRIAMEQAGEDGLARGTIVLPMR